MNETTSAAGELYALLMPLNNRQLLLPNANVSEVIGQTELTPYLDAPSWFLGMHEWREYQVPVVSFERLVNAPQKESDGDYWVAVCKALGGNQERPFIAIQLTGIPKLVKVIEGMIVPKEEPEELGNSVLQQVNLAGQEAWIPNLDSIEWVIQEVLQKSADS